MLSLFIFTTIMDIINIDNTTKIRASIHCKVIFHATRVSKVIALTCSLENLASVMVICLLSANIKVSCNNKAIGTVILNWLPNRRI
jgi:hypothetical protein